MRNWKWEALIIACGLLLMGKFVGNGLDGFANRDRVVNVKGLAEIEIPANKVTWPLMYKVLGNDLPTLYNQINNTNTAIVNFLKQKGITEEEAFPMPPLQLFSHLLFRFHISPTKLIIQGG